jgi:hypothetical protein
MIFSHQITAMEAYLADKLINEIEADAGAFQRLLNQDEDLAREKFTLAEISKDPALVERNVRKHLRSIQYHNLAKVDVLYNIALGIRILSLANDKPSLFKAVMLLMTASTGTASTRTETNWSFSPRRSFRTRPI